MSDRRQGTFDMLNDALFAQMEKLQSIDPKDKEQMEQCVEQTKAVTGLARGIIENANTAISLMRFQSGEGMDPDGLTATTPRMLGGRF